MGKSHATGWALDAPTPAQLKEFFAQIDSGKVTGDRLQAFLRGEIGQPVLSLTESEQKTVDILGPGKVVGYYDVCRVWNTRLVEIVPTMPFSEETLKQCAEENQNGADWRVIWVFGLSLRRQKEIRGTNRKKQPCFDPDYNWWLEKTQDPLANQPIEAGYRLLDFTGRFRNMKWQTQEDEIVKLGASFERAEEQAVAEACFTIYLTSGKKERLLKNWWHWGRFLTVSSNRVNVGNFDENGFNVNNYWNDNRSGCLAVVLSRKF